jgi:hypothetical protein
LTTDQLACASRRGNDQLASRNRPAEIGCEAGAIEDTFAVSRELTRLAVMGIRLGIHQDELVEPHVPHRTGCGPDISSETRPDEHNAAMVQCHE